MKQARRWLCGLAVALASCAVQKQVVVDFSETPRNYLAGDYPAVYERWTRHDYAQHEVDKSLEVWGTFKSWDFREAYIEKYATIYSLSDAKRAELRQAQLDAYHTAYEFHLTAQSADWAWNDLEKSSTTWRLTLLDAAGHELPSERIQLEKLPDAYEREFFPDKTPFTKSYRVRFLVPASGGDFTGPRSGALTLRIAGPIGHIELHWKS